MPSPARRFFVPPHVESSLLRLVRHPRSAAAAGALLVALATVVTVAAAAGSVQRIPEQLSSAEFWKLREELSEPGGYFRSENFVSNETTFQYVIPELTKDRAPVGVYIGVGPEQNFTYIAALQPKVAFIVDIRRQNMLQHLLYKVVMEQSTDRADFLSRLFSRPRPAGIDTSASPAVLFEAFDAVEPDSAMFWKNIAAIRTALTEQHDFGLSEEDLKTVDYVYFAFYAAGPYLNYSFSPSRPNSFGGRRMPTFGELMVQTDEAGVSRSFLANETNFRFLRDMHRRNMIIPLVGDFAGDKALRAVGQYVRDRNATVTAFYTSNVEQYLFQQGDDWRRFFENVGSLPVDDRSTFIRAVFNYTYLRDQPAVPGPRSVTLLHPIAEAVAAFREGKILSYYDVVQMSK